MINLFFKKGYVGASKMVRKKIFIIAMIIFIMVTSVMIGWSIGSGKMYDYDSSTIRELNNGRSFEYRIPTKVPFKDMKITESKMDNSGQQLVIALMNKNKEFLDIRITTTPVQHDEDIKIEKVNIGQNSKGSFISNHDGKRILYWQDDGVYYETTYFIKLLPSEVSKKQLIKMAESFE